MKSNQIQKIKQKISQKKYNYAIYFFKQLPTDLMRIKFDTLLDEEVFKFVFDDRNSGELAKAFNKKKYYYTVSFNSEILWNLLILRKIVYDIKNDIQVFEKIENKILYNDLEGLKDLYESLTDVAKNSHKGIEVLVHLHQLKVVESLPDYQNSYKNLCKSYYLSKIEFLVETIKIKEGIAKEVGVNSSLKDYLQYKVTQEQISVDMMVLFMHIDRYYNDIDFYEGILFCLLETSLKFDLHSAVVSILEDIYQITKDKRLLSVIYTHKKKLTITEELIQEQSFFEYELVGEYSKVYDITLNNLSKRNDDYSSLLFNLKSSILCKINVDLNEQPILNEIYKHFETIFTLKGDKVYYQTYACLRLLEKYKIFSWAKLYFYYVFAYVDTFSEKNLKYFNYVYGLSNSFNPIRLYFSKDKSYNEYFPNSILFNKLIDNKYNNNELISFDKEKICLLSLLQYYRSEHILNNHDYTDEEILSFHAHYIKISKLVEVENLNEATELLVNRIVNKTEFYNLHPFTVVYDKVKNSDSLNPVYELIIIFYQLYAFDPDQNEQRTLISKARIKLELLLEKYEDNRIEQFFEEYNYLDENIRNFFLANIWQVIFMKNNLVYESMYEIQEERINICKKLISLNVSEKNKYIDELQERVKNLEINKTTSLLHSSKVFVDIDSVKKSCLDRLDKSFESFKQLTSTNKNEQNTFFLVVDNNSEELNDNPGDENVAFIDNEINKALKEMDTTIKFRVHKIDPKMFVKFKDIITDVTNEFLMGATGLNSYLSTGIRHGILRNTLRNPLEKEQLMPSSFDDVLSNKYIDSMKNKEEIYKKLRNFSEEIDFTIDFITERLIQISVCYEIAYLYDRKDRYFLQNVDLNVFNYVFTFKEAEQLIEKGKSDLPTFMDELLNLLWLKTDICLARMKHILDTDIKERFIEIFKTFNDSLTNLDHSTPLADFKNSLVIAESNFFKKFQETLQWFNKNNVYQLPELTLQSCIEISKNIICKTIYSMNHWEGLRLEIDNDVFLGGRYVSDIVYIFLDLFNNAYQHSKVDPNDLIINLNIKNEDGIVKILINNNLDLNLIDLSLTREKLAEIKHSILNNKSKELAQKDSNSGLHKINNRLGNAILFSETNFDFHLNEKESKFVTSIEFKVSGSDKC